MRNPGVNVGQGLTNFYLGAKAGVPPVCLFVCLAVNKALLTQNHVPLSMAYLGTIIAECSDPIEKVFNDSRARFVATSSMSSLCHTF